MPRKRFQEEEIEANLLPVMNVMFLMIPALLMAMEFASMASINVSPPKFAAAAPAKEEEKKDEKPLNFKVFVMEDGFRVSADAQQEGAEAGKSQDSKAPTIGLAKAGAPMTDYERWDYAALEAKAKQYKIAYPNEVIVTVSAEASIPMQAIIFTMDALAGRTCKLGKAMKGEKIPDDCLFWQPIVEGGAS